MLHLLSWKLNNSWSIVSVTSMENHAQTVVMVVEQQPGMVFVSSVGNYAPHVVMRVEQ